MPYFYHSCTPPLHISMSHCDVWNVWDVEQGRWHVTEVYNPQQAFFIFMWSQFDKKQDAVIYQSQYNDIIIEDNNYDRNLFYSLWKMCLWSCIKRSLKSDMFPLFWWSFTTFYCFFSPNINVFIFWGLITTFVDNGPLTPTVTTGINHVRLHERLRERPLTRLRTRGEGQSHFKWRQQNKWTNTAFGFYSLSVYS